MLQKYIKYSLFAVALTPLVVYLPSLYPFIFPKLLFFKGLLAITFVLTGLFFLADSKSAKSLVREKLYLFKSKLFVFTALFFTSLVVSTVFAENVYRAFWGTLHRGDGFFVWIHIFTFLVLSILFFSKDDWLKFFKISLVVGAISIFSGLMQFLGINKLPFTVERFGGRPGSFIGNSSFFAAYLFLLIGQSLIVFFKEKLSKWRTFAGILIPLSVIMMFLTGTRGAIVGLVVGFLFLLVYFSIWGRPTSAGRRTSLILLVVLLVFSGAFFTTRSADIWQSIPGLDRLASTSVTDIEDDSTQNRIITWGVSWQAFKEKPILGWGPENYITAYSKHYDPDYAIYGETWLDRAHNIVFDLLVAQGIFGLLTYLLLFGSILFILIKSSRLVELLLAGVLIGYFVQNLFVFDQLNTRIMFYALVGYLIFEFYKLKSEPTISVKGKTWASPRRHPEQGFVGERLIDGGMVSVSVVAIILGLTSLYYTFSPLPQTVKAASVTRMDFVEETELVASEIEEAFYPYNYAQPDIRSYIFDYYYSNFPQIMGDPRFGEISNILEKGINEVVDHQPTYDPRWYLRQTHLYETRAKVDLSLYPEVEEVIKRGLKIAPNRQELYYNLILALAGQEKTDEALEIAEYAVALSPNVARAHFFFGLAHSVAGDNSKMVEEFARARELDPDLSSFFDSDLRGFLSLYNYAGEEKIMSDLILDIIESRPEVLLQPDMLNSALYHFLIQQDSQSFIIVARKIGELNSQITEGMGVLADLARKNKWEIIDNLVEFRISDQAIAEDLIIE